MKGEVEFVARVIEYLESQTDARANYRAVIQEPSLELSDEEEVAVRAALVAHESMYVSCLRSGRFQTGVVRLLMKIRDGAQSIHDRGYRGSKALLGLTKVLAFGVRALPRRAFPWFSMQAVKRKSARTLSEKLRQQIYRNTLPMHPLLKCVTELPQNIDCRAFEVDWGRHIVVGSVIGFDVLPCSDAFTVVEANNGIGQHAQWLMGDDANPFIENMFEFADKYRFRNVEVINNDQGLQGRQEEQYRDAASRFGITLRVIEPSSTTSAERYRSSIVPEIDKSDTLCVRIRDFPAWPDFLMSNKTSVQDSLQSFFVKNDITLVRVPDTTTGWLQRNNWDSGRFPNIVAKMSDSDGGIGVTFYKARNGDHAKELVRTSRQRSSSRIGGILGEATRRTKSGEILLQPFDESELFEGDRLGLYRISVLVTPIGSKMLSATKYRGPEPVPESLPYGMVQNPMPYLVNGSVGASRYYPDNSELAVLEDVAETLGHAMASVLNSHFLTSRFEDGRASG